MGSKWDKILLGDLIKQGHAILQTGPFGTALKAEEYTSNGVPLISVREIRNGYIKIEDITPRVNKDIINRLPKFVLKKGDIVFARKGGVDRTAYINEKESGWFLGSDGIYLRINDNYNSLFISYIMRSSVTRDWLIKNSEGTTMPSLNQKILSRIPLTIPSLQKQNIIAEFLHSLDRKINISNQINQTLEQMSQTLFKSWFVDFDPVIDNALDAGNPIPEALQSRAELRQKVRNSADFKPLPADIRALFPAEFEETELGWVPKAWCFKNLSSVYLCLDSKRIPLSKQERCQKQPGNIPYYGATSVMDYINEYIFDDILLLVGEDGSVIKDDNTPFIQYIWGKSWVNNHAHVLKGKDKISTEQLMLFMSQCNVSAFVTGAVQMKINQKNMGSIQFLKAPDNINTAFNEIIIPFFQKMRATKEQLSDLINLRDTLLPKLISGELSLEDLPDLANQTEPA